MNKSSFEEQLALHGRLVYTNQGDSMEPLIRQGRDLVIIEPIRGPLKKYDIPLYRRDSGQYVLHRILKVRSDGYVLCGDNRFRREFGIQDRHMVGVLTGMVRKGQQITLDHWQYRLYVHLWCDLYWLRAALLGARGLYRRIKKTLS